MSRTKKYEPESMRGDGEVVVTLNDRFVCMYQSVVAYLDSGRLAVRLTLVPPGAYVVTGVEFVGTPEAPVEAADLRIPLAKIAADVAREFTENLVERPDGKWESRGVVSLAEARQVTRRAPKRTLTPEFLREQVAPVVVRCEHDGTPIGRGLAEHFVISESTARNWLMRLRELEGQS
jgi:hypothetical protein